MKSKSNSRRLLTLACLAALLALVSGLFGLQSQVKVTHAMDCVDIDCSPGSEYPPNPSPEPPGGGGGGDDGGDPGDPPEPTEPPCIPSWAPPTIPAAFTLDPAYPITLGQDPDDLGVDVNGILAQAGAPRCPGQSPARIIAFSVTEVRLAASSVAWITGELARKYPGAQVKGSYPFTPPYQVSGLGTPSALLSFHFAPLDPGYYEVRLLAVQSDGQQSTAIVRVPVYLMESSIIQ